MSNNRNLLSNYPYKAQHGPQIFTSADPAVVALDGSTANSLKIICSGGTNDTIVKAIFASNTDTSPHDAILYLVDNSNVKYLIGAVTIAAGAGTTGANKPVNILDKTQFAHLRLDTSSNTYMILAGTWKLEIGLLTAPATGKFVSIICTSEDY